jgi:hypothetical protein
LKDLQDITEFKAHIAALSEQGVSTIEQFISLAMSESREGLRHLLNLSEGEMDALVAIARKHVDPKYLEKLNSTEVKEYPLGCLEDKEGESNEKNQVRDV